MTCENNMMASKKKLTMGMLLYVGVCIMISYGMFGMKTIIQPNIQTVLPSEIIYKVLGKDKWFKRIIENINTKGEYKVKYKWYCCWRGNVLDALMKKKCEKRWTTVIDIIYEGLELNDQNNIDIKYIDDLPWPHEIYAYLWKQKIDVINNEIKNLKSENDLQ